MTPKTPPSRDFDKYFATFQSDPLRKTIGLRGVNPRAWSQFGPILSSSNGYIEYTQETQESSVIKPGRNSKITPIGFDFTFNGATYKDFIASPHGWLALLDPANTPNSATLDTIYNNRLLASGSSSYDNSSIKSNFTHNDLLLAPWFDRQMLTHRDLDSFVSFFSGSNAALSSQKENFLLGKVNSKNQAFDENDFGMRYHLLNDSVEGKALIVRWTTTGYEYRGKKLSYETAIYENGKIEFNYAPIEDYSTQYTLLGLSSDPINVWKLDESTGAGSAQDSVGSENLPHVGTVVKGVLGKINNGAFYSGSLAMLSDPVTYSNNASFAKFVISDTFSFSAWFKSSLDSTNKTILGRREYSSPLKGWVVQILGGSIVFTITQNWNTKVLRITTNATSYNDNTWHHVVVTYDGSGLASGAKIYVDGQLAPTTINYDSLDTGGNIEGPDGSARFMLGAFGIQTSDATLTEHFSGSIDDVARWSSVLNASDVNLIYENALSNNSSADIDLIGDSITSYATSAIFASGSSNWNYRDFSPLLGSSLDNRLTSSFGGALYTGSYAEVDVETNTSASYTVNLGLNNWPKYGGRITFSPPTLRRRLVRSDAHHSERKGIFNDRPFDDRRTLNYTEQTNVDSSTLIPLDHLVNPTYPGVHLKQNLNDINGIKVSNRKVLSVSSAFLDDETENLQKVEPFSETSLHSQGRRDEEFFLTGSVSSFGRRNNSFARRIFDKKTLSLTFSVNKKIKMFTSASSLYYFNPSSNQWNIPTQSLGDHLSSSLQKLSVDTTGAGGTCNGSLYLEDKIGFDSQGNAIVSGNLNIFRSTTGNTRNQSTLDIANLFDVSDHANILIPEYAKSVQRNSSYEASNDELFTLPIDDPFLVEKAVIEIPFTMGNGWFSDKTTFTFVSASNFAHTASGGSTTKLSALNFLDEGGPAITVALFCQRNHGTSSVRDLVFKSTFTHVDDNQNNIQFSVLGTSGSSDLIHVASLVGNENNNNIISDHVSYQTIGSSKQFTGSVLVKAEAGVTNCANVGTIKIITTTNITTSSILSSFENFLNTEFVPINSITSPFERLSYLLNFDSFGKSMSGFGAGSIGESITSENVIFGSTIKNPCYITGSGLRQTVTSSLQSQLSSFGTGSFVYCLSKTSLGQPKQSPYLAYPGDKFILLVAKSRPALKNVDVRINDSSLSTGKIANIVSSSYYSDISNVEGHDVVFNTGSINITLYGSTVKQGEESGQ